MTSYLFSCPPGATGDVFKIYSDSGATTTAVIYPNGGSASAITGSTIVANGFAPIRFLGAAGVLTLYARQLDALSTPIGSTITLTGRDTTVVPGTVDLSSVKGRLGSAPVLGGYQVFQGISNGTDTGVNTMKKHVLPAGVGLDLFSLRYGNHNSTGAGENAGANTVTVHASVGLSTTGPWFEVSKDGATSMPVAGGADIETDPIALTVPAGGTFYEKVFGLPAASGVWSATGTIGAAGTTYWCSHSNGETDLSQSTAAFTATSGTKPFASNAIVSHTQPGNYPSVFIIGDSIAGGQGDGVLANAGFMYYAYQGVLPYVRAAVSGSKLQNWNDPALGRHRAGLGRGCNVAHEHYETNDITAGRTLAQLQADMLTLWFSMSRRGMKLFTDTLGPVTTDTTTFWATLAGQVVDSHNTVRVGRNNWIRDGAPIDATSKAPVAVGTSSNVLRMTQTGHPLAGYFEIADTVESARDSGKWAVHPRARQVTDFATTTGVATITSATAAFTAADVGLGLAISGAISTVVNYCQILSVTNATTAVVNNAALITGTVTGATGEIGAYWGTPEGTHPQNANHQLMAAAISIPAILAAVA